MISQKKLIIYLCLSLLLGKFYLAEAQRQQVPYQPSWESLSGYKCPDWFRDAKFGIFIHWGVYSVPAFENEWYPREMYIKDSKVFKHHVEKYGTQDKFGYKDFIPLFKAEKFNADEWADLFRRSGAKYIVPVAEHHDGFAMYNTMLSRWNAMNMGPKRDIIGELAEATSKQGMIFGLSSHRIEHWWFMGEGKKINSDVNDPQYADFYGPAKSVGKSFRMTDTLSTEFMNDWLLRCCELVDKYHPQLFWFDWWIEQKVMEPYLKTFAAYYYNHGIQWNKGVVINYKNNAFPDNVAVYDIERGSSKATRKYPWQTDTSIGKLSWGYTTNDVNKNPNEIIDALIDIVSKNGNLLLNIGPKPDGTIPQEQVNVLLEIGNWLKVNGEGIYGTRTWNVAGEGPTENPGAETSFNERTSKGYTAEDIRFTTKGEDLYIFCLDIPEEKKIIIKSLGLKNSNIKKIANVELLGSTDKTKWSQKDDALAIDTPKNMPCQYAIGFRIK